MDWLKQFDYGIVLPNMARMPLSLAKRLADWRGDLRFLLRREAGRRSAANIASSLDGVDSRKARRIARLANRALAHDEVESYWFDRPLSFFQPRVRITGFELLREAADSGRGVLLYTAHQGSTGLCLTVLGKMGIPINLVFRSLEGVPGMPPAWHRFGNERIRLLEKAVKRPVIWTERGNYFAMRRKLRQGEVVLMGLDVVPTYMKRTIRVRFLDRMASFPVGMAQLYLDARPQVLLWSINQDSSYRYHILIEDVSPSLQGLEDRRQVTQAMVRGLERNVRRHPEEWLVWESLHDFFEKGAESDCRGPTGG